ncbi:cell surface A33 antigen [Pelodiscus sinensis]|uniref:Glycoprotein A33 n=1 Tax=Pelodiscus sinensis TaxID=13735 RepID=K7FS04_PELSI|nr:cell surface A33 antigen [Pelodiscus sinensis]|eukprot:XP_006124288.1 cell surface A33 antigen [Pelodiscus sinensis]
MKAEKECQLFILSVVLVTAQALTVNTRVKEVKIAVGNNATLPCEFQTTADPGDRANFVSWKKLHPQVDIVTKYFDGYVHYSKSYEGRLQFPSTVITDVSITLQKVTMMDNGTYMCTVQIRTDLPDVSAEIDLLVLVAPSKPECKVIGTPEYGQTINLSCNSHEGSPKPEYTWQSFSVLNQPRALVSATGQQITLKNVSADTSGFYICTATNTVGQEFCNMTVSIIPPSMNIALYAGVIGGAVAAIIVIGILGYCCCCRGSDDKEYEMTEQGEKEPVKIRGPDEEEFEKEEEDWKAEMPHPKLERESSYAEA